MADFTERHGGQNLDTPVFELKEILTGSAFGMPPLPPVALVLLARLDKCIHACRLTRDRSQNMARIPS